jgi:hypothetical protein
MGTTADLPSKRKAWQLDLTVPQVEIWKNFPDTRSEIPCSVEQGIPL